MGKMQLSKEKKAHGLKEKRNKDSKRQNEINYTLILDVFKKS